jgi:hypothetical protein
VASFSNRLLVSFTLPKGSNGVSRDLDFKIRKAVLLRRRFAHARTSPKCSRAIVAATSGDKQKSFVSLRS